MIFYGTKSSNIRNGQFTNIVCPNCEQQVSMIYSVYQKYVHIYWIPFVPIKQLTFTECNSCKKTFEDKELNAVTLDRLHRAKGVIKTSISNYTGLMILAGIIGFAFFNIALTKYSSNSLVKDPKVGDVYYINASDGFYTTLKTDQVLKDSVIVYANEMEIDKKWEMEKIDLDKYYKSKRIIAKKDLQNLVDEEKIFEVIRH